MFVRYADLVADQEVYGIIVDTYFQLRDPHERWRFVGRRGGVPIVPKRGEPLEAWIRRQTPKALAVYLGMDKLGWVAGFVITYYDAIECGYRNLAESMRRVDQVGATLSEYLTMYRIIEQTMPYRGD